MSLLAIITTLNGLRKPLLVASACLLGGAALADVEDSNAAFSLATFGTLSMVRVDSGGATFLPFGNQPSGAKSAWTSGLDSMLAVQARYNFLPSATATLQLTARRDDQNNYRPDIDWAYLSYQPSAGLNLRAGRFVAPLFAASDTRLVGYANLWVRPPVDVYTLALNGVDGADLIWRQAWAGNAFLTQIWGGSSRQQFPRKGAVGLTNQAVEYDKMLGLNLSLQRDGLGLRLAHMRARQTFITTQGLPERGLSIFGDSQLACMSKANSARTPLLCRGLYTGFAELEQGYDVNQALFRFSSAGVSYERGPWRLSSEAIWLHHHSRVANSRAAYITLARSFEQLTPYITWSWHRAGSKTFEAAVKPEYETLVKPNLKVYRPAGSEGPEQDSQSLGLRWDAMPGLAFKAQIDRMRPLGQGNGVSSLNRVGLVGRNLSSSPAIHVYNLSMDFAY
ncbi:hypothetical protein LNV08_08525 [Paucibacter sp. TC2R-5]|uniref:hypothetical protein n=1 Tax=Paucibacter sp. TC2R-5 TaxID=2893555 RepID=UPI0021E42280|nr:hypothetical protein [Paucibacter sp. TC2R-5]MCV2359021.1 hypothetical protein [Paucibacter sp. TC2R-5]